MNDDKNNDDAAKGKASSTTPTPSSSSRPSMLSSLRNFSSKRVLADDDGDGDGGDNDDSDSDDFVFTDSSHGQQAFKRFSQTLTGFGLTVLDDNDTTDIVNRDGNNNGNDSDDEQEEDQEKEDSPLLDQNQDKVKEEDDEAGEATHNRSNIDMTHYLTSSTSSTPHPHHRRGSKMIAYHDGQKESFLSVLDEIDRIQQSTKTEKGFQEWKFTFGLMNCLFIAFCFGKYPEHFWILYAIETIFWMSYKFHGMYYAKPLCEALYYLDFCWVMNTLGVAIIVGMIFLDTTTTGTEILPVEWRKMFFIASFGVFCGPVFMAAMTLPFVAFLFHDVNTMANLIIHLMPCMAMYHHRWHAAEISAAYPTIFPHLVQYTEDLNSGKDPVSVTKVTLMVYFAWFIPYTIWMLLFGLRLPVISKDEKKPPPKYDTVFHSTVKGGVCELVGTTVWKRSKAVSRDQSQRNDYEIRDFLLYMTGHVVASCGLGIFLIGDILCYGGGKNVHAAVLWLATIICAERGAKRYTYYVTAMYGKKLRHAFHKLEQQQEEQQMQLQILSTVTEEKEGKTNQEGCKYGSTD